jgi:hypothetical protein
MRSLMQLVLHSRLRAQKPVAATAVLKCGVSPIAMERVNV